MAISPQFALVSARAEVSHDSPGCIYSFDLNGNVIEMNAAMADALGYAREEAARMNLGQLLEPESWKRSREQILAATRRRRAATAESYRDRAQMAACEAGCGAATVVRTWPPGGGSGYWTSAGRSRAGQFAAVRQFKPEARRVRPLRRTTEAVAPAEHHQLRRAGAGARGSSANRLPDFSICPWESCFKWKATRSARFPWAGSSFVRRRRPAGGVTIPLWQTRAYTVTSRLRTVTASEPAVADGAPRIEFETYIGTPVWLGSELFATLSFSGPFDGAPRIFSDIRPRTDRIDGAQRRARGSGTPHPIRARPAAKPGEEPQPRARNGGRERKHRHHPGRSGAPGGGAMPGSALLLAAAEG